MNIKVSGPLGLKFVAARCLFECNYTPGAFDLVPRNQLWGLCLSDSEQGIKREHEPVNPATDLPRINPSKGRRKTVRGGAETLAPPPAGIDKAAKSQFFFCLFDIILAVDKCASTNAEHADCGLVKSVCVCVCWSLCWPTNAVLTSHRGLGRLPGPILTVTLSATMS